VIDRPLTLIIIDNDPIFRLGLVQALSRVENIRIIAEGDLESIFALTLNPAPEIIIIDPLFDWSCCQILHSRYPDSKIVLLTFPIDSRQQLIARELGIAGYIPKGTNLEQFITILGQISRDETYDLAPAPIATITPPSLPPSHWLIRTGQAGLNRIERELHLIDLHLNQQSLSAFDRFYWQGRKRELLAALWLVRILTPVASNYQNLPSSTPTIAINSINQELPILSRERPLCVSAVFESTLTAIRSPLINKTNTTFEIDVLHASRKRELLYLILDEIRKTVDEMRYLQISISELASRLNLIISLIWTEATEKFLEIYASTSAVIDKTRLKEIILEERETIQTEILNKIPFTLDLFSYLVYENSLKIDGVEYRANAPETIERAEILLHNLLHNIANAVTVVILNNFSEYERVKQQLYRPEFLSARELAKIRNELSWKYRRQQYWQEPKAIFESQYQLFHYSGEEIQSLAIYSPRQEELNSLTGIPWLVSIALELRDSLSPRLRAFFRVIGKGVVYILIQVIGRGIGLVIRGVLQGVGNTWQEVKGRK
jgi:ActR/RegA family two-component response regulator